VGKRRVAAWFLFLLLPAVLLGGCGSRPTASGSGAGPAIPVGVAVGDRAPDFTLTTVDGTRVSLAALRGKPVMLNFWATYCPYCREEMPDIQSFYASHPRDVAILGVNLTSAERGMAAVRSFLRAHHYTFPVVLDVDGKVADLYLVRSIPLTLFINARGIICFKYAGAMSPATMMEGWAAAGLPGLGGL